MTLLEVAKHALEAMEDAMYRADTHEFYDAKESLRYAIEQAEQAEQEPISLNNGRLTQYPDGSIGVGTPTPRKPLTDEVMRECAQAMNAEPLAEGWPELIKFARAIERHHGIGEQHD